MTSNELEQLANLLQQFLDEEIPQDEYILRAAATVVMNDARDFAEQTDRE